MLSQADVSHVNLDTHNAKKHLGWSCEHLGSPEENQWAEDVRLDLPSRSDFKCNCELNKTSPFCSLVFPRVSSMLVNITICLCGCFF